MACGASSVHATLIDGHWTVSPAHATSCAHAGYSHSLDPYVLALLVIIAITYVVTAIHRRGN